MYYTILSLLLAAAGIYFISWHATTFAGGLSAEKNMDERRTAVILSWLQLFLGTVVYLYFYPIEDLGESKYLVYSLRSTAVLYLLLYFNYRLVFFFPFLVLDNTEVFLDNFLVFFKKYITYIIWGSFGGILFTHFILLLFNAFQDSNDLYVMDEYYNIFFIFQLSFFIIPASIFWPHLQVQKNDWRTSEKTRQVKDWGIMYVIGGLLFILYAQITDGVEDTRWLFLDIILMYTYVFHYTVLELDDFGKKIIPNANYKE